VSALAGRSGRYLLLYGGTLLLVVVVGAVVAYSESLGGDNGPYLLLVGALTMTVAGVILLQWRIGVVLLVAALPYESVINFGPVASGMKVLALLTFISFALALLTDQKLFERFARLWHQPLTLAVLAFVLWVSASNLWATYQGEALRATIAFLGLLGSMVIIGSLETRYLILVWACFVLSSALSVPAGYILPVPENSAASVLSGRFGPGGATPNTYACDMAIVFFVAYFGLLRRHRGIAYFLAPVFLYGIVATGSRTGLIALVATPLLALLVPRLVARLGWRVLTLYIVGATFLAVMALAIPSVTDLALERYTTLSQIQSEETWNGRWSSWQGALDVIASHPILGVGAGNFAEATIDYSEQVFEGAVEDGEPTSVAHNIYLGIASELGLVGLTLFLGVLFFLFRAAVPLAQRSDLGTGILVGLIVFMIAGLTLPWGDHKMVYYLFGSVLALQLHYSGRRAPSAGKHERRT
jgi:O-antigen ligase